MTFKDSSCFAGSPNLNAPTGTMCWIVSNSSHEEMLLSRNKVEVEASWQQGDDK